jgi:hypothetical protein
MEPYRDLHVFDPVDAVLRPKHFPARGRDTIEFSRMNGANTVDTPGPFDDVVFTRYQHVGEDGKDGLAHYLPAFPDRLEIGKILNVSPRTIESHQYQIIKILNVKTGAKPGSPSNIELSRFNPRNA